MKGDEKIARASKADELVRSINLEAARPPE
jgi:hypothetical protein